MSRTASHKLERWLRLVAFVLGVTVFGPALGQQGAAVPRLSTEAAKAVMARMSGNAHVQQVFAACPADKFRRAIADPQFGSTTRSTTMQQCTGDPGGCYERCLGGSGAACFKLARVFQDNDEIMPARYAQMLFSMSCGFGYGAGCTNRASSIRNSLWEGDPFLNASEKTKNACQFRTFKIACREDDAWGCAMLGQSYKYGEGARRNSRLARSAFRKSCRLAPDFEACSFSKESIGELATAGVTR